MTTIIGVRFKAGGKMYYFDPQDMQVSAGEDVIVETARGLEYGECVQGNTNVPDQTVVQPLKRMVRVATEADKKTLARNKKRADEAFIICKRKIMERGLEMNLVTVECTFDMNKMLFYFTADGRVDFRELVKEFIPCGIVIVIYIFHCNKVNASIYSLGKIIYRWCIFWFCIKITI